MRFRGWQRALRTHWCLFEAKSRVIDRVIPDEMKNFIKVACRHRNIGLLNEIFENYEEICRRHKNILHAVMRYVTPPKDEQLKGIKAFLCRGISG